MFKSHKENSPSKSSKSRKNRIRSLESLENRRLLTVGCTDFEQIVDQSYDVDESFVADHLEDFHMEGRVEAFTLRDGSMIRGFAQVSTENLAGGSGREVQLANAVINADFNETPQGLSILFGEYGGSLNLQINEEFLVFENFQELNGLTIGGVSVEIIGGNGNDMGVLTLRGQIDELKIGGQELFIDQVCLLEDEPIFDFGDAPDVYGTLNQSNGPYHLALAGVRLGAQLDAELDGNPDVNSDGDDLHGNDDEDGVIFLDPVQVGNAARVQVLPSTQGWLNGWIDFNRDGTFSSTEKVADALPVGGFADSNIVEFVVPDGAIPSGFGTHSRWRFSTTYDTLSPINDLELNQFPPDGEVEDHLVFIDEVTQPFFDFGDAPDTYGTTNVNNGPYHVALEGIHLGAALDVEFDGNPDVNSDGDDLDGSDDEDGVILPAQILIGQTASFEVLPSVSGFLNAWIDFDRDGSFGSNEKIADRLSVGGFGDTNIVAFTVPNDAIPSDFGTHSRWRFSTTYDTLSPTNDLEPNQFPPDGEVEDHLVFISQATRYEWGDAPAPFPTIHADNGAQHVYDPGVLLGDRVDADPNGQPTPNSDGDDTDGEDDDDGVRFLNDLVPGGDARVELTTVNGGTVNAWIDFNGDGVWDPQSEAVVAGRQLSPGTTVVNFPVPEDAKVDPENPTFSRWRITTDTSILLPTGGAPDGFIPNGEVEDHSVFIVNPTVRGDFNGDRRVDHDDIGEACRTFNQAGQPTDLNGDGRTDKDDLDILIHDILGTHYGDANLDGRFNSGDLVQVFAASKYETGAAANWAEGDWNCDGVFDSGDLVASFVDGGYTSNSRASHFAAAVDELFADQRNERDSKDSRLLM